MKKKLLTSLGCFALATVGAIGLVGCGKTEPHEISFKGVKELHIHNTEAQGPEADGVVTVGETTWDKVELEPADVEGGVKAAYKLTSTGIYKVNEDTKNFLHQDYELCVSWACDGVDQTTVKVKGAETLQGLEEVELETPTLQEQNTDRYYLFISLEQQHVTSGKTLYFVIDWDGNEQTEEDSETYKFVVPGEQQIELLSDVQP